MNENESKNPFFVSNLTKSVDFWSKWLKSLFGNIENLGQATKINAKITWKLCWDKNVIGGFSFFHLRSIFENVDKKSVKNAKFCQKVNLFYF